MLRTPLLPLQACDSLSTAELRKWFDQPIIKEAIFLASPPLFRQLSMNMDHALNIPEGERLQLSFRKYLLRSGTRSTPFGLFAGVSKGDWAEQTTVALGDSIRRSIRLDTDYVALLVDHLSRRPEVLSKIKFFPNNTIYSLDDKIRYIEYRQDGDKRSYYLSNVAANPYLDAVLKEAAKGMTLLALAESIRSPDIDPDEALRFVEELIESRLLVSELEMRLTGMDYYAHVRRVLQDHGIVIPELREIDDCLMDLDQGAAHNGFQSYAALTDKLALLTGPDHPHHYIQVDTYREAKIEINQHVARAVEDAVSFLGSALPPYENEAIRDFRAAFFERYEYQVVNLCEALDPEVGIGYPLSLRFNFSQSALLNDVSFPQDKRAAGVELTAFQNFLIGKYAAALPGKKPVELQRGELAPFCRPASEPSSCYAFVTLLASVPQAVDAGDFRILFGGYYGPSAVTLMARFCHLDQGLASAIQGTVDHEEQQTGAIFAEIVHANQPRVGNISTRPLLRDFEIPILALSGVDHDHTLPLDDLTVQVYNGRLVLKSKRLNREIIPRLSSAHNYAHDTVSAYRFLCDLQFQGTVTGLWDWGVLREAPFLPRVCLDNLILSPARWRLTDVEVAAVRTAKGDLADVVSALRTRLDIPARVSIGTGDNKITLDLDNNDHLPVFQKLLEDVHVIDESFLTPDQAFIQGPQGQYVHEMIVPMTHVSVGDHERTTGASYMPERVVDTPRHFSLGSEWLYFKLYGSPRMADAILVSGVLPIVEGLLQDQVIDKWFFIRYTDPDHHIRLRLHGQGRFYEEAIARLQPLFGGYEARGMLTSVSTATYSRELERYGPDNIVASESLFFIDSQSILALLTHVGEDEQQRWHLAMACAGQWFDVFGVALEQRVAITGDLQAQFVKEMNGDKETRQSLAGVMRKNKKSIDDAMDGVGWGQAVDGLLALRRERLAAVVAGLLKPASGPGLDLPLQALLKSYLHLTFNRLFSSHQRHYEMVLYDLLFQFYGSRLARQRKSTSSMA